MFIVLENVRSAYNVWNIIRTADALGYDIIISGYTPSPFKDEKVRKTSLWAENSVKILEFWNPKDTLTYLKSINSILIWAEICHISIWLKDFVKNNNKIDHNIAIIFGNEVEWVLKETLETVDFVVFIPMIWEKESLNVWQSAAIFMREFSQVNI